MPAGTSVSLVPDTNALGDRRSGNCCSPAAVCVIRCLAGDGPLRSVSPSLEHPLVPRSRFRGEYPALTPRSWISAWPGRRLRRATAPAGPGMSRVVGWPSVSWRTLPPSSSAPALSRTAVTRRLVVIWFSTTCRIRGPARGPQVHTLDRVAQYVAAVRLLPHLCHRQRSGALTSRRRPTPGWSRRRSHRRWTRRTCSSSPCAPLPESHPGPFRLRPGRLLGLRTSSPAAPGSARSTTTASCGCAAKVARTPSFRYRLRWGRAVDRTVGDRGGGPIFTRSLCRTRQRGKPSGCTWVVRLLVW